MKSRKLGTLCLVAVVLFAAFALTGCQLAREEGGESQDRLIGVFLTTSHLELGSAIATDRPQDRLYATLETRSLTDEATGAASILEEYVFQDIEGISFLAATVPATEDTESYTCTSSDGAISDGDVAFHYKGSEDKLTLEGTVYVAPSHAGVIWYINPVYQSTDGSVYATAGNSISFSGDSSGEGVLYATTLEETTTITENGKAKSATTAVKISLATMYPPEQVAVIQMGPGYNLLASTEYAPTEVPHTFAPLADTQFIVVEEIGRNSDGGLSVSRALYGKNDNSMETFYCREDGVCVKQYTNLEWGENR